jgi:hypothetical protein
MPVFDELRQQLGLPVLTDIHTEEHCAIVAPHVDVLADPGVPVPPDRSAGGCGKDRQGDQCQERASFWRPGT